jgi:hypothetical protein
VGAASLSRTACKESAEKVDALAATTDKTATALLGALSRRSAGPLLKEEALEVGDELEGDEGGEGVEDGEVE